MSVDVQDLISQILTRDPSARPALHEIVDHEFFTEGTVPSYVPRTAQDRAPDFKHISRATSKLNLQRLRRRAMLDDDDEIPDATANMSRNKSITGNTTTNMSALTSSASLAQQEREFQRAVQPGSPISALLGAARQPLVMGSANANTREREQPLIRKFQAVAKETRSLNDGRGSAMGMSGPNRGNNLQDIEEEDNEPETKEEAFMRRKELEAQKARIVAQMTCEPSANVLRQAAEMDEMENVPPPSKRHDKAKKASEPAKELRTSSALSSSSSAKLQGFDAVAHTLQIAFDAKTRGKLFRDPKNDVSLPDAKVFIVSWVDYCNKYGMGYALTDGTVGVHFNDSTSIMLSPDKE